MSVDPHTQGTPSVMLAVAGNVLLGDEDALLTARIEDVDHEPINGRVPLRMPDECVGGEGPPFRIAA